jgi:limonene-1,2-epoxide hydrolase
MDEGISRRALLGAAPTGAAALTLAASFMYLAGWAEAATPESPLEKANTKLLQDFIASWTAPDFDPDKSMKPYVADDIAVRFPGMAVINGAAALAKPWREFIAGGQIGKVKLLDIYAKGPIVVATRRETIIAPGKPDTTFEVAGVFIVETGKIKEWNDYALS